MVAIGDTAGLIQYVHEHAPEYGLDPAAVLANAVHEGWGGGIGDGGLAYGPWQDHFTGFQNRGPWYGAGRNNQTVQQWAWSPDGINEAMREMVNSGAKGLSGYNAVEVIARKFEASADIPGQTKLAWQEYQRFKNGSAVGTTPSPDQTGGGTEAAPTDVITSAEQIVAGQSSEAPSLFGSADLGKAVARLTSPGFWWAAGLMILAGLLIVLGLIIYFRKDIESAAGTVARGAVAAA